MFKLLMTRRLGKTKLTLILFLLSDAYYYYYYYYMVFKKSQLARCLKVIKTSSRALNVLSIIKQETTRLQSSS